MVTVTKNGVSYIVKETAVAEYKAKGYTVVEKKPKTQKKGKK